ncbi:MAG: DUF2892 domain-containing protein [Anaerolineales bacterium]|nr:DUF2892 domain-containing protein [Anaerolineales bacterium]MCB9143949.1 DUF2892 domain-containing protein [Anaerolineales bacterium]
MKRNMSNVDRIVRLVISAVFVYLSLSGIVAGTLGTVLLVLAVIFTLTSILAFCPLYLPFKINTNKG